MIQRIRNIFACAFLAVLIAAGVYGILFIRAATAVVAAVPGQISETRSALTAEVAATRQDLMGQVAAARKDATGQLTALQANVFSQVTDTRAMLDRRVGDSLARVDTALGTVDQMRADLQPVLTNTAALTGHVNSISAHVDDALPQFTDCAVLDAGGTPIGGNPDCLFNRFQGMSKAFEKASVDVSGMTHDFRGALPSMLLTSQKVGDNSDRATAKTVEAAEQSRRLLFNLAENTTPLPKWVRYPAQVIGLIGSAAVPVVTIEKLATIK